MKVIKVREIKEQIRELRDNSIKENFGILKFRRSTEEILKEIDKEAGNRENN